MYGRLVIAFGIHVDRTSRSSEFQKVNVRHYFYFIDVRQIELQLFIVMLLVNGGAHFLFDRRRTIRISRAIRSMSFVTRLQNSSIPIILKIPRLVTSTTH